MKTGRAVTTICRQLNNNIIEIFGNSESGKSYLSKLIADRYEYVLFLDSVMKMTEESKHYIAQTNNLKDVEEVLSDIDVLIIDDFCQLSGDPKKNIYLLQEWIYNYKKLSIILINQIRANFNKQSTEVYKPYANYVLERYTDHRFMTSVENGEYVVTQIK